MNTDIPSFYLVIWLDGVHWPVVLGGGGYMDFTWAGNFSSFILFLIFIP